MSDEVYKMLKWLYGSIERTYCDGDYSHQIYLTEDDVRDIVHVLKTNLPSKELT
jgi:hypothetical protein